jgi:hypothetical protein
LAGQTEAPTVDSSFFLNTIFPRSFSFINIHGNFCNWGLLTLEGWELGAEDGKEGKSHVHLLLLYPGS